MTPLSKTVSRVTQISGIVRRPIVIMLEPGGTIGLREKGRRTVYRTTIEAVYILAARTYAAEARRRVEERKARR